jgi:FkbM family methyltransferase
MVRLGRFLSNEGRLDVPNVIETNGELMVQRVVLQRSERAVIFDVGANQGEWTLALMKADGASNTRVFAFELSSKTAEILRNKVSAFSNVTVVPSGLSDHEGQAQMEVAGEGAGTNSLHASHDSAGKQETVQLTTVDAFCSRENIRRIDLLKIDAEGHDMFIMEGARTLLQQKKIQVVQFEYNWRWLKPRRTLLQVFEFFQPLGYVIGKITPNAIEFYSEWHHELEKHVEANYVACLPECKSWFAQIPWWNS